MPLPLQVFHIALYERFTQCVLLNCAPLAPTPPPSHSHRHVTLHHIIPLAAPLASVDKLTSCMTSSPHLHYYSYITGRILAWRTHESVRNYPLSLLPLHPAKRTAYEYTREWQVAAVRHMAVGLWICGRDSSSLRPPPAVPHLQPWTAL